MKNLLNYISAALFLSLMVFASCGGDEGDGDGGGNPLDDVADNLSGTANINSVTKPADATELDWSGFQITFSGDATGGTFSTQGSADPIVWPASGTWTFANDNGTQIDRSASGVDDVPVNISFNGDFTSVTLTFTIATTGSAKAAGVIDGQWVFAVDYN